MRSRLAQHQKKQLRTLIIVGFIFIVFFFYVGIPLLAQSSFFLTNLFKGKENTDDSGQVFGGINIDDVPEATNSSRIMISGSAENYEKLEFVINGEKVGNVKLDASADFNEEIGDLNPGNNEFYIIGYGKMTNQKKQSQKYSILYLKDKPKLEIKEPQDNSKTSHDEITVSGNTDKEISIFVNGLPVVVNSSGDFNATVKLKDGENKIIVRAQDNASNTEEKTLTVTYEKD